MVHEVFRDKRLHDGVLIVILDIPTSDAPSSTVINTLSTPLGRHRCCHMLPSATCDSCNRYAILIVIGGRHNGRANAYKSGGPKTAAVLHPNTT
jgi:hypothetical protein